MMSSSYVEEAAGRLEKIVGNLTKLTPRCITQLPQSGTYLTPYRLVESRNPESLAESTYLYHSQLFYDPV